MCFNAFSRLFVSGRGGGTNEMIWVGFFLSYIDEAGIDVVRSWFSISGA